jgi:hypothetical protein
VLDEYGLGNHRAEDAGTQKAGKTSEDMDGKDDEIAHLSIVTNPGFVGGCAINQQFARDRQHNCFWDGFHDITYRCYRPGFERAVFNDG